MTKKIDKFADYVEHPRYGRRPRFTNLVPRVFADEKFVIKARCGCDCRIDGTAIAADMGKQSGASYFIKYYFDEKKLCIDCNHPFIFFAQEQKHWFDVLGFSLNTEGRRCYDCRQIQNQLKRNSRRFAVLKHMENRNIDEMMEMADICLGQLEVGRFHPRQVQTVRMFLKKLVKRNEEDSLSLHDFIEQIRGRILNFEEGLERSCKTDTKG